MRGFFKFLFWLALLAMIAIGLANWLLVDYVEPLPHNDMAPTLAQGDSFVLYRHGRPERGDVVVCDHPNVPGRPIVGRVVAVAGETVEIRRGFLHIDGRPLESDVPAPAKFRLIDRAGGRDVELVRRREYFGDLDWIVALQETRRTLELAPRRVDRGLFLLSDNRTFGTDSRHVGEFDVRACRGTALFVLSTGEGNGDLDYTAPDRRFALIR